MAFMGILVFFVFMIFFLILVLIVTAGLIALKILAIAAVFWGTLTAIAAAVIYCVLKKKGKLSPEFIDSLEELPHGKLRKVCMKILKAVLAAAIPISVAAVILSASYLLFDPVNRQITEHAASSYSENV